jgi:hypothetical protein
MNTKFLIVTILASFFLFSCDEGLKPLSEIPIGNSYVSGTINYVGNISDWPPDSSFKSFGHRLILLEDLPDTTNLLAVVLSGKALFTDVLPLKVASNTFSINLASTPISFKYVAVAQNYGELTDWRVLGLYSNDNKNPKTLTIPSNSFINNLVINVDFKNLPPQPF